MEIWNESSMIENALFVFLALKPAAKLQVAARVFNFCVTTFPMAFRNSPYSILEFILLFCSLGSIKRVSLLFCKSSAFGCKIFRFYSDYLVSS